MPIPETRPKNALYCSRACYYYEKLKRDNRNYHKTKKYYSELVKNEKILATYYPFFDDIYNGIEVEVLIDEGFVWDRFDETIKYNGDHYKRVGDFAFCLKMIDEQKKVLICKLKESR
ncbi:MAG: hypothetical protein H6551_03995 [Chitinophagales bacterium]|nr:hypothetical protein [Chitinophagales bacterium]